MERRATKSGSSRFKRIFVGHHRCRTGLLGRRVHGIPRRPLRSALQLRSLPTSGLWPSRGRIARTWFIVPPNKALKLTCQWSRRMEHRTDSAAKAAGCAQSELSNINKRSFNMHFFNKLVFAAIATGATVSLSLPASAEPFPLNW